ncbi:quinolinate synthase NadA [Phycisphaerales bacterium AB-hyl4]|uniref:Quinolinate synthase n=1 Tax=Natronomicrosphaera hydrolytica TaxID=3242702 RepID=A0ABV4TZH1_9BACT
MLWQPPLPERYAKLSDAELARAIQARKAELGSDLIILGHHYQQDEVVQFADFTGDSFKLSQEAAERVKQAGAKYVVFCGVHFMAESADILTPDDVAVVLPDLSAGCSMADMADYDQTVDAWRDIHEAIAGTNTRVIPITYMNSSAAIKSFVGEHGGAVCTSSNADKVLRWALAGGDEPLASGQQVKIIFLPDQHLGRNTAAALGYDVQRDMALWDPRHPDGFGGLDDETIQRATFLLWKGHCSVHKLFRPEHVEQIRAKWPDVTVMVHPECDHEVVKLADRTGSTEGIIQAIESAPAGSRWAIGTEVHLVNRLAKQAEQRGVTARILSDCQCLCTTMFRINMPQLLWTLDQLASGKVVNQIKVHPTVQKWSLVALDRMLAITGKTPSSSAASAATA